jgi:hypothetical protein
VMRLLRAFYGAQVAALLCASAIAAQQQPQPPAPQPSAHLTRAEALTDAPRSVQQPRRQDRIRAPSTAVE